MSPMTRAFSPAGVPGADVSAYYRRRAEGGAGLILTEGTWIPHPSASYDDSVPRLYGDDALKGWSSVIRGVHAAGARLIAQLWHTGLVEKPASEGSTSDTVSCRDLQIGPSGFAGGAAKLPRKVREPMATTQINEIIDAYAQAAANAKRLGFDGIELHGGHGYLIDQFFWTATNRRTDRYGGGIAERSRFAADVVSECRRRTGPGFAIFIRISQWKLQDFGAKMVATPTELLALLTPLLDAGVDLFDCSQRRYWEPEFPGSDLNLSGWVRKLSGKPTMTVGSIGMNDDLTVDRLDRLMSMFDAGQFDLAAVARGMLADAAWTNKMRAGYYEQLQPFNRRLIGSLE
jgi:2,4-dienoyl-CoA reductase-like NADH-dependent reductase (Old Yellow Enzyme family)